MRVQKFESFITEDNVNIFNNIYKSILESNRLSNEEKELLINSLPINEGFISDFKEALVKAKDKAKDKAKQVIDKVIDWADSGVEFIKKIINYLKEKITEMFNNVSDMKANLLKNEKFVNIVTKAKKTNIDELLSELKVLAKVATFYTKDFVTKLLSKLSEVLSNVIGKSDEKLTENMFVTLGKITEGISVDALNSIQHMLNVPGVERVIDKIEHMPPFSYLHSIKNYGEAGIKFLVSQLSALTKFLGGPEFEIPVIASLLAIGIEYNIKSMANNAILLTGVGIVFPPAKIVLGGVVTIASFLAAYSVIKTLVGEDTHH
jgi:hypothetical protein